MIEEANPETLTEPENDNSAREAESEAIPEPFTFSSISWARALMNDERVPDGRTVGVALGLAARAKWSELLLVTPSSSFAARHGVDERFVDDLLTHLVGLGFLEARRVRSRTRKAYTNRAARTMATQGRDAAGYVSPECSLMRNSKILDRGPEKMVIFEVARTTGRRGNSVVQSDTDRYHIRKVHVVTDHQSEAKLLGQVSVKVPKVSTRIIPGVGSNSIVWLRGEYWDLAAPEATSRQTRAVQHQTYILRSRNEVGPDPTLPSSSSAA